MRVSQCDRHSKMFKSGTWEHLHKPMKLRNKTNLMTIFSYRNFFNPIPEPVVMPHHFGCWRSIWNDKKHWFQMTGGAQPRLRKPCCLKMQLHLQMKSACILRLLLAASVTKQKTSVCCPIWFERLGRSVSTSFNSFLDFFPKRGNKKMPCSRFKKPVEFWQPIKNLIWLGLGRRW